MKKIIATTFLILLTNNSLQAQLKLFGKNPIVNLENFDKDRYHFGFFLGFSNFDYKIDYKNLGQDITVNSTTGFNVGLIGNLRLNEYLDLRFEPGLYYTSKTLQFSNFTNQFDAEREVNSTYINFPLLLKFSAKRTGNIKPYLVGGLSRTLNLSSNEKSADDNSNNRFRTITWSNNYEIGFGIDIYFQYFKFSPWTSNIENMTTRGIFVNFAFH